MRSAITAAAGTSTIAATSGTRFPLRAAIGFDGGSYGSHLTGLGHHRDQDAELGRVARLEDRLQLPRERVWVVQKQLDPTSVDSFKEGGRLVAAEIQEANRRGQPFELGQRRVEGPAVFGDGRPVLRLQERKLGAQEADTVSSRLQRRAHFRRGGGVGEDANRVAVAGNCREGSSRHGPSSRLAGGRHRPAHRVHVVLIRRCDDHAPVAVDDAELTLFQ